MSTFSQKQDMIQSGVSYMSGGGMVAASFYTNIENYLHLYGLIIGCLIVTVRLVYDGIALSRRIRDKKDK